MAVPADFKQSNLVLGKPSSMSHEECDPLNVYAGDLGAGHQGIISCWKLTQEELDEVNETARIWSYVFGLSMPPISVSGINPWS